MRNVILIALALGLAGCATSGPRHTAMEPKKDDPVETAEVSDQKPLEVVTAAEKRKALDREIAENAGVLGALREPGDMNAVFGSSALDSNLSGGVGGLVGAKGTQVGSGGLGLRGTGRGGGGSAAGIGGLGTKGAGGGYGTGSGGLGRKRVVGRMVLGATTVQGIGQDSVRKVMARRSPAFGYCYERSLRKDDKLVGVIVAKVWLHKDGRTEKVELVSSGKLDARTLGCVERMLKRLRYPAPGGPAHFTQKLLFSKR